MMRVVQTAIMTACVGAMLAHAEVRVMATVDRKAISIQETMTLQVTVEDTQNAGQPVFKSMSGFGILQGPVSSSQMLMNNGTMSCSITYTYVLGPKAVGSHTIGPIEVEVGGKTYRTDAMVVEVTQGASQPTNSAAGGGQGDQNIVILLQADKTNAYQNEPILLSLTLLYRNVAIRGIEPQGLPTQHGKLEEVSKRSGRTAYNGVEHDAYQYQMLLIPYKTGPIAIDPVAVKLQIQQQVSRQQRGMRDDPFFNDDIFDQFFGRVRVFEKVVQSNPLTLEVSPTPDEGKPASFNGAVGTYTMSASISTNALNAGEPVTLTVDLSGKGDLDVASMTFPTNTPDFRVYDPEVTKQRSVAGGQIVGSKKYTQMWVPCSEHVTEIPRVAFSYFDPATKQYVEIAHGPFPLKVSPAPHGMAQIADYGALGQRKAVIKMLKQDILDIKKDPARAGITRRAETDRRFIATLVVPPVAAAVLGIVARRRVRLQTDTAFYRRSHAKSRAHIRIAGASAALRAQDGKAFYTALADAVAHFIADHLQISAPQVAAGTVATHLRDAGVPDDVSAETAWLLELCDYGRFASTGFNEGAAAEHLDRAEGLLGRLRKELR